MKRESSTDQTGPIKWKGPRTPTNEIIKQFKAIEIDLKGPRKKSEAFYQMDIEQRGRLHHDLRWRAQHGDTEAETFLKTVKR
jgi:hypothetical protein